MKYPKVVPRMFCKTPITVTIYAEDVSEEGAPIALLQTELKCNYQSTAKTVYTADKKAVQLSGAALFHEDFCPDIPVITGGFAMIDGVKRTIHSGAKGRNPDGTVNYIRLELV